jgi:glycosidase
MGRMAHMMKQTMADISDEEAFKRIRLANALLFFSRGVPVLYYGDEQGFVGDGGDQAAREDMFESLVDSYNDNDLIATDKTTRDDNFDPTHPLFKEIAALAQVYHQTPALRNGKQKTMLSEDSAGLFAFERSNNEGRERILVAINTASDTARALPISNMTAMSTIETIIGSCPPSSDSNQITIAPLDFAVCKINEK